MDHAEIAHRRRELFPPDTAREPAVAIPFKPGSSYNHCEICPKPDGAACGLVCAIARDTLGDGVKVT